VPREKLAGLVADLKQRGTLAAAVIGSISTADKPGVIEVSA
jgi:selenide,water dikinase